MTKKITRIHTLLILALMFAAPGGLAYWFFQHPEWLQGATINKGTLLQPPLLLNVFDGKPKWRLMLWSPEGCASDCVQQLEQLAKLRLALGRKLYEVDQWLIMGNQAKLEPKLHALLQDNDVHDGVLSPEDTQQLMALSSKQAIYIVNPDHYLILSYTLESSKSDVYKDLTLLLNTTQHQSGSRHAS